MSAHILNIFIEKISRGRSVRFSPHGSGTAEVLRTVLVHINEALINRFHIKLFY
jgi:hypothetical protein